MNINKDEQTISTMFDRIATRYDFLNSLLSFGQDARWRKHLVSSIPYKKDGRLLDIATGTGVVLEQAIQKHPEYRTFVGIDISNGMLAKAKERLGEQATLYIMSAMQLDFPDNSFDCITFAFGLRNVPDPIHVMNECARVLKPGGTLIILDFFKHTSHPLSPISFYNKYILPFIGGLFSDKQAYSYLPKSMEDCLSTKELQAQSPSTLTFETEKIYLGGACSQLMFHTLSTEDS